MLIEYNIYKIREKTVGLNWYENFFEPTFLNFLEFKNPCI